MPTRGTESFTVIGPDLRPVDVVDEYLLLYVRAGRPGAAISRRVG